MYITLQTRKGLYTSFNQSSTTNNEQMRKMMGYPKVLSIPLHFDDMIPLFALQLLCIS